jgi:ribosomal protein L37AE/L43A
VRLNAGNPVSTLFGATCAQLFNAVVERRVWHRCAKCDKPFLRRWSTESAQYCNERCAKAAASKAYRDRKRAAGPAPSPGDAA